MKGNKIINILTGAVVITTVSYFLAIYFSSKKNTALPLSDAGTGTSNTTMPQLNEPGTMPMPALPAEKVRVTMIQPNEQCIFPEDMLVNFTMPSIKSRIA